MKKLSKKPVSKAKILADHSAEKASVVVIMGSKNDLPIMKGAMLALKDLKVSFHALVVSAHRTPEYMSHFAVKARHIGYKVIIAGAGGAAHLPGMVASLTTLPVIGVPIVVGKLKGLDALLSIAQMPKGVPVACVSIENAYNAGLLAARILATQDHKLTLRLEKFKKTNQVKVLKNKI